MQELLREVFNLDLSARAQAFLNFVENVDPCFLSLVVAVLVLLGSRMVIGQPAIRGWGLRLAVGTFLLYFGYQYYITEVGSNHKLLVGMAMRAGCVAGVVLAFTWIIVPIASFVLRHIRLALAAFLLCGAYLLLAEQNLQSAQLPFIAFQSGLAAALALLIAWIMEPFWTYVVSNWLPQREAPKPARAHPELMDSLPPEVVIPIQMDQPRRRRTTMLAAQNEMMQDLQEDLDVLRDREAQRRREKARLQLELIYMQAMPLIKEWLPREMYDDFVQRHLSDQIPPSDVEENARQLQTVLQQYVEQVQQQEFSSIEDLTRWLLAEQQRIQSMGLDQPLKQSQILDLHQRYLAIATRLSQSQPAALPR